MTGQIWWQQLCFQPNLTMPMLCHAITQSQFQSHYWSLTVTIHTLIYWHNTQLCCYRHSINFCHAMLCKCGLCHHAVSVCVCVHHVRTFCQNELTYLQHFSPSGSHTIVVFPYQTAWQYSDGNPPPMAGRSNAGGVGINHDSESISGFTDCC